MARTLRYFTATDGKITVFRASATMSYVSCNIAARSWSKSAKPGNVPAVETDRAAYQTLIARKQARTAGMRYADAPTDSWVENDSIAMAA